MKKLATLLIATFSLVAMNTAIAQNTCCSSSTVAPEITVGTHGTPVGTGQTTPAPVLTVNPTSDLPTLEYLVTKRGQAALDAAGNPDVAGGGGDVIIGASVDGMFMPNTMDRYGITLTTGDIIDLTAIGYDLPGIKTLADGLLNGAPGGQPCCGLFAVLGVLLGEPSLAGFCDTVRNAGISGGSDINNMNDVLVIFDAFSSSQISVEGMISVLQTINQNGAQISPACGGQGANNFVPYGVNKSKRYGYEIGTVSVRELSDVSVFFMYPNPTTNGEVQLYLTTQEEIDLTVNVYDALGQRVYTNTLGNVSGNFNTQIATADLPAGIYHVELTDGHSNKMTKLVVQ